MKNIEKYKDVLLNAETNDLTCCVIDLFHNGKCPDNCKVCKQKAIEWFLSEYEKPVLDDAERKYLSDVIKPFGHRVSYIVKRKNGSGYYIAIILNNFDVMNLPYFTRNTMYKGMTVGRNYKLKELGL